jgi:NTE family protein
MATVNRPVQTNTGPAQLPGGGIAQPLLHAQGTAIVLSGGGAKGDFEVGALRCLYNRGIRPAILCGTSVGSINALKLAEGENGAFPGAPPAGHVRGLAGLEKIWLELKTDPDMWQLEPGVAGIFDALKNLPAEVAALKQQASQVGTDSILGVVGSLLGFPPVLSFAPQLGALGNLKDNVTELFAALAATVQDAENITGLANYDPLEAKMRMPVNFFPPAQQASGIKLRLAMVALEDGALRYVDEAGIMRERDGQVTPIPPPATPADIAKIEAEIATLEDAIDELAPPDPNSGHFGPIQKPNAQLGPLKGKLAAAKVALARALRIWDIVRAAIASSSLPVICRPIGMQDGRTYIDGGIRTLAPIEAAVEMGASEVFAIAGGSSKFDAKSMAEIGGSTPLPLLGIALRVGEQILPDEVGRRDLFPYNPWPVPVTVIQPLPGVDDIHDGLTIEPGLIHIRMAYGFMRAYDTLLAYDEHAEPFRLLATRTNSINGKTAEIVALRKAIWDLEFAANGRQFNLPASALPPAPYTVTNLPSPDAAAHAIIKTMKQQLKALLDVRVAFYTKPAKGLKGVDSLPADFNNWPTNWEKHSWTPSISL